MTAFVSPTSIVGKMVRSEELCAHIEVVPLDPCAAPLTEWPESPGQEHSSFLCGSLSFCGFFEIIDDYYGKGECFFLESKAHREYHVAHLYFDLKK